MQFGPREHGHHQQPIRYPGMHSTGCGELEIVGFRYVDAAGRRWRPDTYVEMLTRTKMMNTYREATTISALELRMCSMQSYPGTAQLTRSNWEGKIIKLTAEAPGPYPTYDQLRATKEIFHPHCKHTFTPIRSARRYERRR
ncbi:hypothetical protein P7H06_15580 [Paenibacillus larvae]|nr:phage minor capsid protein [Paenibacillus larvae]MDT2260642.1 hypothetical protein [Paenibacillus larvae]